jgi:hypothetical protein
MVVSVAFKGVTVVPSPLDVMLVAVGVAAWI